MPPPSDDAPPPQPPAVPGDRRQVRTGGGYFESSWDLAHGLEVTVRSSGALPDEFRRTLKPAKPVGST